MAIKIKTTVPPALLAFYNKTMESCGEDIYVISADTVGDCSEDILRDTAAVEEKDEVTVSAAYLVEEVRWNLTEKLTSIALDAYADGTIPKDEYKRTLRILHRAYAKFKAKADKAEVMEPWLVTEI